MLLNIRKATFCDISDITQVHLVAFNDFFLSKLGNRFVYSYYSVLLKYQDCILLVSIDDDNNINGFVAGFKNKRLFYSHMLLRIHSFLIPIIFALIKNPSLIRQITHSVLRVVLGSGNRTNGVRYSNNAYELSSIAVRKKHSGIGSKLINAFEEIAFLNEAPAIYLTTDKYENEKVNAFYLKCGYRLYSSEQRSKRSLNIYAKHKIS